MSLIKNLVEPIKNDHLARMSAMDTDLIRMKYLSASIIDALYNLIKSADRKVKFKEALEKVELIVTKAANDKSWKIENDRELQRYIFPDNHMELYVQTVTCPQGADWATVKLKRTSEVKRREALKSSIEVQIEILEHELQNLITKPKTGLVASSQCCQV